MKKRLKHKYTCFMPEQRSKVQMNVAKWLQYKDLCRDQFVGLSGMVVWAEVHHTNLLIV